MLISTCTDLIAARCGLEHSARTLCEAGYDCLDLTLHGGHNYFEREDRNETLKMLKKLSSEYGVRFVQAHAPFGGGFDKYTTELVPKMPAVFDFCGELGIDVVDLGVPVLSMHAPYEIVAKSDVYSTYRACFEFFKS